MSSSQKVTDFLRRPINVTKPDVGRQKKGLRNSLTMKLTNTVKIHKTSPEACDELAGLSEVKSRLRTFEQGSIVQTSSEIIPKGADSQNLTFDDNRYDSTAKDTQIAVKNGQSTTKETSHPVSQRLIKTATQRPVRGHLSFKLKQSIFVSGCIDTTQSAKVNGSIGCKLFRRTEKLFRLGFVTERKSDSRKIDTSAGTSTNVSTQVAKMVDSEGKVKPLADSTQLSHSPPDHPTLKKLFTYPNDHKWKTNTTGNIKSFEPVFKSRFAPSFKKETTFPKDSKQTNVPSALQPLKSKKYQSFKIQESEVSPPIRIERITNTNSESISGSGSKITEFLDNPQAYQNYYLRDLLDALETNSADLNSQHFRRHFRSSLNYLKVHSKKAPVAREINPGNQPSSTENSSHDINKTAPSQKPKDNIFLSQTKTEYGFALKKQEYAFPSDMIVLSEDELVEEEPEVQNEGHSIANDKPQSKLLVLFDLDETLIRSDIEGNFIGAKEADFTIRLESKNNLEFGVIVRPHLAEVLEILSAHCEIGVFTASREGYAKPIIDRIDPRGLITKRFYRQHCSLEKGFGFTKLLRGIEEEMDINRVIIVDNLVGSFANELYNGIPILPFYGDRNDDQLAKLLPFLLHLVGVKDVKAAISLHFTWHDWLQKMG